MPNLKPFRSYSPHDEINLFSVKDQSSVNKGTFVKIAAGWVNSNEAYGDTQDEIGSSSYIGRAVSNRYVVQSKVDIAGSGDAALGMLLWDVRETDENGEKLIFNPRKAEEMQVALSGQAVPIATKGIFLYSGALLTAEAPNFNSGLYVSVGGELSTLSTGKVKVGTALGGKDSNNCVLVRIDCDPTASV